MIQEEREHEKNVIKHEIVEDMAWTEDVYGEITGAMTQIVDFKTELLRLHSTVSISTGLYMYH